MYHVSDSLVLLCDLLHWTFFTHLYMLLVRMVVLNFYHFSNYYWKFSKLSLFIIKMYKKFSCMSTFCFIPLLLLLLFFFTENVFFKKNKSCFTKIHVYDHMIHVNIEYIWLFSSFFQIIFLSLSVCNVICNKGPVCSNGVLPLQFETGQ